MVSSGDVNDEPMLLVTAGWAEYRPPYDWFQFMQSARTSSAISSAVNDTGIYNNLTSSSESGDNFNVSSATPLDGRLENRSLPEIVIVCIVVVFLSLVTAGGNLLVIVSFKMDLQLQTVSNYFLLSLSVADLTIGLVSMPLYSVYLLMNYWPLGRVVCDAWLSLDYTMSNASVANLLLISFDRYFSVTRPLTYRARRTPSRAAAMIAGAWTVSALLWTPWILAWPYIEGRRTVPPRQCYIQFLETNKYFTILTAIAAFYLPVLIMSILFLRIYRETEKRQKGLAELQGCGGSVPLLGGNFRVRTSATATTGNGRHTTSHSAAGDRADSPVSRTSWKPQLRLPWRTDRGKTLTTSPNVADPDLTTAISNPVKYRKSPGCSVPSVSGGSVVLHGYSCRRLLNDADPDVVDQTSPIMGHRQMTSTVTTVNTVDSVATPGVQPATPSTAAMSDTMKNFFRLPLTSKNTYTYNDAASSNVLTATSSSGVSTTPTPETRVSVSCEPSKPDAVATTTHHIGNRSAIPAVLVTSAEGDETKQLTGDNESNFTENQSSAFDENGDSRDPNVIDGNQPVVLSLPPGLRGGVGGRRPAMTLHRVAMQACVAARLTQVVRDRRERKQRQQQEKKAERKAARTLTAILLAFVVTWTPYNVFILIQAFCPDCIHPTIYAIGYWLCYINSTINPVCYALCNTNFRRTYWRVLTCRWISVRRRHQHGVIVS